MHSSEHFGKRNIAYDLETPASIWQRTRQESGPTQVLGALGKVKVRGPILILFRPASPVVVSEGEFGQDWTRIYSFVSVQNCSVTQGSCTQPNII